MRSKLIAALAALTLASGSALAQQSPHASGSPRFNLAAPFAPAYGGYEQPAQSSQSAHNALPTFTAEPDQTVMQAELLPQRGTNGPIDTANALPPGFEVGTPGYAYAQSVQQWFASQAAHERVAIGLGVPHS
jgi:hypothetical protein